VYCEIDEGLLHRAGFEKWLTASGAPWPATSEFETGCTVQHAGYAVSWLAAMFGPVRRVRAYSKLLAPDKGPATPKDYTTPDFSCGCLEFDDGIVARITNSVIATHDHRMRLFGDEGELRVDDIWDFASPVAFRPIAKTKIERSLEDRAGLHLVKRIPSARRVQFKTAEYAAHMDFCVGIADMAEALKQQRNPRLTADFALHVTEVSLALQYPEKFGIDYQVTSSFEPIEPMPWAR
jgi:predicted dehydrogenase